MEVGDVGDSGVATGEAAGSAVRSCERGTTTDGGESLGGSVLQKIRYALDEASLVGHRGDLGEGRGGTLPTEP